MTVCNFTPPRIGIITSRVTQSWSAVGALKTFGISMPRSRNGVLGSLPFSGRRVELTNFRFFRPVFWGHFWGHLDWRIGAESGCGGRFGVPPTN